nr:MAG TPA: zinc finger domain-containing protein [Caudoviricetes sp.]
MSKLGFNPYYCSQCYCTYWILRKDGLKTC